MKSMTANHRTPSARQLGGFTLIELMIVVAIVGILAAVAYPSYSEQVRKSRRADAMAEISKAQQAQERWRSNNTTYSSDVSSSATGLKLITGTTAATSYNLTSGYYTVSISGASATGYTLTATAIGAQASDAKCTALTATMSGGNIAYGHTGTGTMKYCWNQ